MSMMQPYPAQICILRMSAIGDICHCLPVIRTIQLHWPKCKITWVVGQLEHSLIGDIENIDFISFNKKNGYREILALHKKMRNKQFDFLLHMQTSARSNIVSLFIPAKTKLGYNFSRAKELHWLVTNKRIENRQKRQHQIDDMFNFSMALGIPDKQLIWNIPIPEKAKLFSDMSLPGSDPIMVINPCASQSQRVHRNWSAKRFATVADYVSQKFGYRIVLCGGPSPHEVKTGNEICKFSKVKIINLIAQTDLKQLLAVLKKATFLLSPDSGPVHMAAAVDTPVVGLYAATNPFQTGPYHSLEWVVNKYPEAVKEEYGQTVQELPWGIRAHGKKVMELISADDVISQIQMLLKRLDL